MQALGDFWYQFRTALWNGLPRADDLARFLLRVSQVIVVTAITLVLARAAKRWAGRLLGRSRINPNVIALAGNGVFLLVILLGAAWLLGVFGASWTAVVASLSVITVAIGLALQDLLKNLVAGVYLLLEQPFGIGDQVALKGVAGQIEGIDIRTTILRTEDGVQVLVPNTIVFTEIVTNRSAYHTRRVALRLAAVRVPFQDLSRLVADALTPLPTVERSPAPKVTIQQVNGDTATIGIEYWQRDGAPPSPEVLARLRETFPDAAITVVGEAKAPATA